MASASAGVSAAWRNGAGVISVWRNIGNGVANGVNETLARPNGVITGGGENQRSVAKQLNEMAAYHLA